MATHDEQPPARSRRRDRHRRSARAASLAVVLVLVVTALPLVAGASTGPALTDHEIRSLETELRAWQRCQWLGLMFPSWACSPPIDPEQPTAELARALRSLSGLEAFTSWRLETGQRDRALGACLGVAAYEITRTVQRRAVRHIAAPHRTRSARKGRPTRKRRWVSRFCDGVPVPEWLDSHRTLGQSGLCRYATDASGQIRGAAFSHCLKTLAGSWLASAGIGPQPPPPNIIVVLADDQRWDTIDATHSPAPELGLPAMPATWSRLAREGITFTQAIVTTPVCGPARGSFFSGKYAWRHGMTGNGGADGPIVFDNRDTWATRLDDAGYQTSFLGKYMNGFKDLERGGLFPPVIPPGWDDFKVFDHLQDVPQTGFRMIENGEAVSYAGSEGSEAPYTTDVLAAHALDFIDAAAASPTEAPFALWISPSTPHHPWQQAERHRGVFDGLEFERYPNFAEADVSDKPAWIQSKDPRNDPEALVIARQFRIKQLEMQLSTDEMVAALIDRLEAHGIADDTIIVYTSDNGHGWGEHRWYSKACPWDVCLRVPLLIHYPRLVPGPRAESGLVSNVDLVPTLLRLAGVEAPDDLDGSDLSGTIHGFEPVPERDVLIETYAGTQLTWAGVRNERLKYIVYPSGEQALYDLERDPWELDNFIEEPEYAEALQGLMHALDESWPGFEQILP